MPARHRACSAHLVRCPLRACSAHLVRCPLGSPASHRSSPGPTPDTCSLTGKNRGEGQFHGVEPHDMQTCKTVQAVPRVMHKKTSCSTCCKKTSCSTCHAKNKLFHMLQKPCKKQAVPHVAKNHAKTMQNAARTERQPAEPSLSPGSLLYVLYVLYLTRQATEHPLSPGSLLYVLYVLYLTRQATEHPLSPGSLLYVLYVLYLTRQATEHPLSPGSLLYVLYVLYGIEACSISNMYQICIV